MTIWSACTAATLLQIIMAVLQLLALLLTFAARVWNLDIKVIPEQGRWRGCFHRHHRSFRTKTSAATTMDYDLLPKPELQCADFTDEQAIITAWTSPDS
jgi:hypothetical protein